MGILDDFEFKGRYKPAVGTAMPEMITDKRINDALDLLERLEALEQISDGVQNSVTELAVRNTELMHVLKQVDENIAEKGLGSFLVNLFRDVATGYEEEQRIKSRLAKLEKATMPAA
ncbi:hypothetical protein [Tropicibacter sp. Alg240-R139]|uniref:hypothetical protein n=1 Tax=Tropicibacter sp. Alg240-R139 TaxID=2305991 RepID=UPI0013E03A7D|nr:hypothetical protein [Tropicibacter sp. Alg240-R139]